jgi:hypothetical protein
MAFSALASVTGLLTLAVLTAQASSTVTPQASDRDVVLSEIAWKGTTASSSDEWIELHNKTSCTVDLSGWTLCAADGTPCIGLAGSIPAVAYFILERARVCAGGDSQRHRAPPARLSIASAEDAAVIVHSFDFAQDKSVHPWQSSLRCDGGVPRMGEIHDGERGVIVDCVDPW